MFKKRVNREFDEIDRSSRVKMHKSGKNWVRTVMSQLSLLRVMRGKSGAETLVISQIDDPDQLTSRNLFWLKGVLGASAATMGTVMTQMVTYADESVSIEQIEALTDTLVDQDSVVIKQSEVSSESSELALSEVTTSQELVSQVELSSSSEVIPDTVSTIDSDLESLSVSESLSSSEVISQSTSVSQSFSESMSVSTWSSELLSLSVSSSESLSATQAASLVASPVANESQ